ncbi:MAG TPA: hypothetical protein VFE41_23470 [Acetobacteraceae bacterium]|nr:hypothetical protein [Acetobacteraceae bacterium]
MDAIVFSGGSACGEEAIIATMTGLKDEGLRTGAWDNIAHAAGAIIYDFGGQRLNEIYPDKRLAQAALHALRQGVFPLGARAPAAWRCGADISAASPTPARVRRSARSTA